MKGGMMDAKWFNIVGAPQKLYALYKDIPINKDSFDSNLLGFIEQENGRWSCFAMEPIGYKKNKNDAMDLVESFINKT